MIKTIYWKVKVPQNPEHHQYVINSFLAHRHRDRLRLLQTLHDRGKENEDTKLWPQKFNNINCTFYTIQT